MAASEFTQQQEIETLYASHHGWLRNWLRRRLGDAFDAADLAHDTYLRVMRSGRIPPVDESRRHLTQIANGLVIDLYRRRQIEAACMEVLAQGPLHQEFSEEARALAVEALLEIDTILRGLHPNVRTALLLCKIDGMTYRDIAARLKVSVSSVEKYIAAGLLSCHQAMLGVAR
ncbi:sigma-70 family RNA polymerase sigma factor [Achromobacter pestifer]|uniref:Sigma-70 family RNA polymerase sigma factor n=1 Tax=Achromobacter pestifer TaxID=1353889 RepID=A0A7D4HPQ3_9BURK|nr:sigma-70 family RNA polymerase sigma factor [Achromobacter pestifer]QKH34917.1 sigma-70 family RNA polymerase sigma factor [Achromobacter pestifer]